MKIGEIRRMLEAITKLQDGTMPAKLAYGLAKNRRALAAAQETFEEAIKGPYDAIIEAAEKDRIETLMANVARDDANQPIREGAGFKPKEGVSWSEIDAAFEASHPDLKDAIEQREARVKVVAAEDIEVQLHVIAADQWPDTLHGAMLDALLPIYGEPAESTS